MNFSVYSPLHCSFYFTSRFQFYRVDFPTSPLDSISHRSFIRTSYPCLSVSRLVFLSFSSLPRSFPSHFHFLRLNSLRNITIAVCSPSFSTQSTSFLQNYGFVSILPSYIVCTYINTFALGLIDCTLIFIICDACRLN